ncbi:MAG: HAD family hydrolase [Cyanobacteria bacterium]|nr:HAD family hydrolase [Cyanobacteriota bacterium]
MIIYFDIDDTLIDHSFAARAAIVALRERSAPDVSDDRFISIWNRIVDTRMRQVVNPNFLAEGPRALQTVLSEVGCIMSSADAFEQFELYLKDYARNWRVFSDVEDCLRGLHGKYRLGVISNGVQSIQMEKLTVCGIDRYFDSVITSEKAGVSKPSAAIFVHACEVGSHGPGECVYVGDDFDNDVIGATEAGFRAIWLNRRNRDSRSLGFPRINTLRDLNGAVPAVESGRSSSVLV